MKWSHIICVQALVMTAILLPGCTTPPEETTPVPAPKNVEVTESQEARTEQPTQLKQKVDSLIQKLGDDEYATRRAAQKELINLLIQNVIKFDALLSHIKKQSETTDDVEIKVRLKRVARYSRKKKICIEYEITNSLLKKFPDITIKITSQDVDDRKDIIRNLGRSKQPDAVIPLIKVLEETTPPNKPSCKDPYGELHRAAIEALGETGDSRAVEPLIKILGKGPHIWYSPSCRSYLEAYRRAYRYRRHSLAAEALGKIGKTAVKLLIKALGNTGEDVREAAVEALGIIKDVEALKPLLNTLGDKKARVRTAAAWALGEMKDARTVPSLAKMLDNSKYYPRAIAVHSLCNIGKPAIKPIIKALQDSDWYVRGIAAAALGEIKDASAIEPLMKMLAQTQQCEQEEKFEEWQRIGIFYACGNAIEALGNIGEPAIEPLIKLLRDDDYMSWWNVSLALTQIGKAAVIPLIKALDNSDSIRRRGAIFALGLIDDPRAIEPLIKALKDTDSDVREEAADALGRIKDLKAANPLAQLLADAEPGVRLAAALALGNLKDKRAIEPLIEAFGNEDSYVRSKVKNALINIGELALDSLNDALEKEEDDKRKEKLREIIEEITKQ